MNRFSLIQNVGGVKPRREKLEGRDHLVVPTAMIAEGVWAGSNGPIYYPDDEINAGVFGCNHRPIVVYHPQDEDGKHISACSPHIINTRKIGITLNTKHDDKLRCEAWIDILKANAVDVRVVRMIERGETIECSTGVVARNEPVAGNYNGKDYTAIARNLQLDHLAILPDQLGAYSIADGGGVLQANTAKDQPERVQTVLTRSLTQRLAAMGAVLLGNELSFNKTAGQLTDLLAEKFGKPGKYWDGVIRKVFSNYVVFATNDGESGYGTFKIGYTVSDEVVSLSGDAVKVEPVTEYREVSGQAYIGNSTGELVVLNTEPTPMAFDKKKYVSDLIASGSHTEDHRAELEGLSEATLQTIKPTVKPTPTPTGNAGNSTTPTPPAPTPTPPVPPQPQNLLDYFVANREDPTVKGMVESMRQSYIRERDGYVTTIVANKNNVIPEADLKNPAKFSNDMLAAMSALAKTPEAPVAKPNNEPDLPALFFNESGNGALLMTNAEVPILGLPVTFDANEAGTPAAGSIPTGGAPKFLKTIP